MPTKKILFLTLEALSYRNASKKTLKYKYDHNDTPKKMT